jgi:hypothetical protein
MAKRRVSLKLEPGECEAVKAFAKERGITISKAGRELIRQSLGIGGGQLELKGVIRQLTIMEKRTRRAQIAAYRAYAGVVELIRFIAKDDDVVREILEALVDKSGETIRKEEERGDYK